MLEKLKILTLLQLSEKIKLKAAPTFKAKLGIVGKTLVAMGIAYGVFVALFYVIFNVIFFAPTENLFIFFIFLMQLLSIVSCVSSLSESLYVSKDNMLLLTYPVKHIYVYISKLVVAYILELRKSLFFTLPLFMAYATIVPGIISVNFVLSAIIYSILLPLFPVLLGALLSIPVVYIQKVIKKYTIAKIVLTLVIVTGLVLLTGFIITSLPDELRIVALYNTFLTKFNAILQNVNSFAMYALFIGRAMYGNNILVNDLIAIGILLVIGGISVLVSMPLFFKLASSQAEHSIQKEHASNNVSHKSTFATFMRKELLLSVRNIGDFASNYLFLFIMPFVLIIMSSIYIRINRNDLGFAMTYAFIGLISLIMLSASNTASATAISSEGNEFVLLKTAPGNTSNIVWSKLLVNFVLSVIALSISFGCIAFVLKDNIDVTLLWLVYMFVVLIDFGLILWSIQLDILNPKLREYENSRDRSSVNNFSSSITIGCIVSALMSALLIIVLIINLSYSTIALILAGVGIIFAISRLYFLINYMNAYFNDIQL